MGDNLINLYEPRTMIQALEQVSPIKRFFRTTFFGTNRTHDTQNIEFDFRKGKRRVAVYVGPLQDGIMVERDGFETRVTAPAYVKEMTALRPQDVLTRSFGENIYNAISPAQRAARALGEDLAMLSDRMERLEEKMCAEAVLTGKVVVNGKGINTLVDFGYDGKNLITLSGTALWSDPSADPMKDLDTWRINTVQRCGITPDICVVGPEAGWAIINNPKVSDRLNRINYQMGRIAPENLPQGISYYGDLMLPSGVVHLYSYLEWYTDSETGEDVPLMPSNKVLLGSTQARGEFHYGLIQNLKSMAPVPRFPSSWEKEDGSARYVQLESAPMPNLFQVDAFTVATVL